MDRGRSNETNILFSEPAVPIFDANTPNASDIQAIVNENCFVSTDDSLLRVWTAIIWLKTTKFKTEYFYDLNKLLNLAKYNDEIGALNTEFLEPREADPQSPTMDTPSKK
jgi:hypothetical protein